MGAYVNNKWYCDCGTQAEWHRSNVEASRGQYFARCTLSREAGCRFFMWERNEPAERAFQLRKAGQASAPVYQTAAYQAPIYQTPAYQQQVYRQPVYQTPVHQTPIYQQPVYQTPAYQTPPSSRYVKTEPVYTYERQFTPDSGSHERFSTPQQWPPGSRGRERNEGTLKRFWHRLSKT